jgi:EAL domain-containing protein
MRNLDPAMEAARRLGLRKVAIAIDDAGPEWLSLTELSNFPFVEFKVGPKFVAGCGEDRLKQSICRRILDLANFYGSRTVADGIETWSDFLTVRDLGFDLVQGALFAKPMSAEKFRQTCWAAPQGSAAPPLSKSIERLSIAGGAQPTATSERPARFSTRTLARNGAGLNLRQATMRSKAPRTAARVSFSVTSSVEKLGMSEARASRSLSARGASSDTNGLSRQSRSTWVSVW